MDFRYPSIQAHYNQAVIYLNFGTPKKNKFSVWNKWRIYYFQVSQYLSTLGYLPQDFFSVGEKNNLSPSGFCFGRKKLYYKLFHSKLCTSRLFFFHSLRELDFVNVAITGNGVVGGGEY